jgi:hypothetical protein
MNKVAAADFGANQFRSQLVALSDEPHLPGDNSLARVMHLRADRIDFFSAIHSVRMLWRAPVLTDTVSHGIAPAFRAGVNHGQD